MREMNFEEMRQITKDKTELSNIDQMEKVQKAILNTVSTRFLSLYHGFTFSAIIGDSLFELTLKKSFINPLEDKK